MDEGRKDDLLKRIFSDPEFKKKVLGALEKLGFPLEFRVRKRLQDLGFNDVRNGYFSVSREGVTVSKEYDITAFKQTFGNVLDGVQINVVLELVGDCKYSDYRNKFLLAVPETGRLENRLFVGPLLTSFQMANSGVHENKEVASEFRSKFGNIVIASSIRDPEIKVSDLTDARNKKKPLEETVTIKEPSAEHEKIYNICEDTILPALKERYLHWRESSLRKYRQHFSTEIKPDKRGYLTKLKGKSFSSRLIMPIIVTSKPILVPEFSESRSSSLIGIKSVDFLLYTHPVKNPEDYTAFMGKPYPVGIFIATEDGFENLLSYLEIIRGKTLESISKTLNEHPEQIFQDFKEIEDLKRKGTSVI